MGADRRALVDREAVVAATAERLEALHALLARFWARADRAGAAPPDAVWRLRFATAVAEIGANIVRHAYPPGTGIDRLRLRLRLRAFPDHIEARFTDRGAPFTRHCHVDRGAAEMRSRAASASRSDPSGRASTMRSMYHSKAALGG